MVRNWNVGIIIYHLRNHRQHVVRVRLNQSDARVETFNFPIHRRRRSDSAIDCFWADDTFRWFHRLSSFDILTCFETFDFRLGIGEISEKLLLRHGTNIGSNSRWRVGKTTCFLWWTEFYSNFCTVLIFCFQGEKPPKSDIYNLQVWDFQILGKFEFWAINSLYEIGLSPEIRLPF